MANLFVTWSVQDINSKNKFPTFQIQTVSKHETTDTTIEYENNSLVFNVWGRFSEFKSKHGCTNVKVNNVSDFVYVLRIDKSCQGRWEELDIHIFSSLDEVILFVKTTYAHFVDNSCYHCEDFRKPDELDRVIDNLMKNKEAGFGECSIDYDISYFEQVVEK